MTDLREEVSTLKAMLHSERRERNTGMTDAVHVPAREEPAGQPVVTFANKANQLIGDITAFKNVVQKKNNQSSKLVVGKSESNNHGSVSGNHSNCGCLHITPASGNYRY